MDDVQCVDILAELNELRQRVAELEAQTATESPAEERSTRRSMLRPAGAAVVGGLLRPSSARNQFRQLPKCNSARLMMRA